MKIDFKVHPFFLITAIIILFTGYFKDFIYITIIILVHELGHISVALFFKWKIEKVIILPFGGITIFNELLNKSILEEFLILIFGPIFQIVFINIINIFIQSKLLYNYHLILLIFNLIPIIPLDGSKLVNLFTDNYFSYKKSLFISMFISWIFTFVLLSYTIYKFNLILFLSLIFLIIKNILEYKNYKYKVNLFLFERYRYSFNFKKYFYIKGIDIYKLKRNKKGIFIDNNMYYTEKQILKKVFEY